MGPTRARRSRLAAHLVRVGLYVPLTIWATWPVARDAADHVLDAVRLYGPLAWLHQADIMLHTWILAWEAHALTTAPVGFLDANIFCPARWALVRSELELGNLLLFAPFYAVSGNPVLAHHAAMLLTYVLAGATAYALVWRWLGRADAAFVAGLLFALGPNQLATLAHVQVLATLWLPLVVLFGTDVLAGRRRGSAAGLAAALVMEALCSAYLGALAFTAAAATGLGWWLRTRSPDGGRARRFLAALVIAGALSLLAYMPYMILGRAGGIPPAPPAVQATLAARPLASYLPTYGRPQAGSYAFLSFPAVLLGLVGLFAPARRIAGADAVLDTGRLRAVVVAVGAAGWLLSLGPSLALGPDLALPLPFALFRHLPGLAALRAPARFGTLVTLAASLLAGFGVAALVPRERTLPRLALVAGIVTVLAVELSGFTFPMRPVETGTTVPPVYRWLAANGGGQPVLELPVGADSAELRTIEAQSRYTYLSVYHWSPLLNGYSAYPPESFFLLMAIARRLPDEAALQDLVNLSGLRWIVVHGAALGPEPRRRWETPGGGLVAVVRFGQDSVFQVTGTPAPDLRARLAWPAPETVTLTGVPIRPLPADGVRGALRELELPASLRPRLTVQAWVTVENQSDIVWPGFGVAPEGLLQLGYRWIDADDRTLAAPPRLSRVPVDLRPGQSVRLPFAVEPPARGGAYRLRVTLVQETSGGTIRWLDDDGGPTAEARVTVVP